MIIQRNSRVEMKEDYQPHEIEEQVQCYWDEYNCFSVAEDHDKEKFYCLSMFPYPSGRLHMGHVRNYTIGDVISKYQRMCGKNVMQPMGWDSFGMPAENAAIVNNTAPAKWTYQNIEYMKKQLKRLGFGYDWKREITTCRQEYYKWEQWFFTQLYEKGLAYKKMSFVNWCPLDQTVLANEQAEGGRCWRCDTPVERRELSQWFLRITAYADELLEDLDQLSGWPDQVIAMQRNWIGRSEGAMITFKLAEGQAINFDEALSVYTTRADTIMGVTYIGIASEHPLAKIAGESNIQLAQFIKTCRKGALSEADMAVMEKRGIDTGIKVIHPITGNEIPVWAANFVLMDYGSGAVMSVPAHDQRDYEFASLYGLPILEVIQTNKKREDADITHEAFTGKGVLVNSGQFNGMTSQEGANAIIEILKEKGLGEKKINYRLRDWGVSRQRYWGAPIPVCYLDNGDTVMVPLERLPVKLPEDVTMDGVHSPLKQNNDWRHVEYEGTHFLRETDTFDTFMESSWYYARYTSPNCDHAMLDKAAANYWLPVDQYIGGIEHAVLHLLYARFFHKLMRDIGLLVSDEPFKKLLCQGMVLADSYYRIDEQGNKQWLYPDEVTVENDPKEKVVNVTHSKTGEKVVRYGMCKMSKSKNNGIDPQALIEAYGADTIRLYVMFSAPPEQNLEWMESGVEGAARFLRRFWRLVFEQVCLNQVEAINKAGLDEKKKQLRRKTHEVLKKVTDDYSRRLAFNTAIASVMELTNEVSKFNDDSAQGQAVKNEALELSALMLAPIVPHIMHVVWQKMGHKTLIINEPWPQYDESALVRQTLNIVVQVNGKVRAKLEVDKDLSDIDLEKLALSHHNVFRYLENSPPKRVIVVPGKLVNIVV